ncbi:phage integrase SAM-like domain-containing protein [Dyadobacter sp. CY261]|uniref:phage integrase SAM-like domain-containing protein n=1 Tax=Dyadobacter sp. CY261 TaxID=2907203 RepID=UPI001F2741B8|nr:phage integrase SAM-like domain-containing protein [Dyadobacter sp. CY261]MCF0070786.1 phage integrase SAM-like domain-containing protein [Dyadobacter sp. CY261]
MSNLFAGKIGQKEEVRSLNAYLDSLQIKIFEIQCALLDGGKVATVQLVKDRFLGIEEKPVMILDVFREHNDQMLALVGKDYSITTFNRYEAARGNVMKFLLHKLKVKDLPIERLDYGFISHYAIYLKVTRHISHNTAMRYLK